MKLSIFTACLPEYDFKTSVTKAKDWGFDGVEWRVAPKPPIEKPVDWQHDTRYWSFNQSTVDENDLMTSSSHAATLTRNAGLTPVSLTSGFDITQLEKVEQLLSAAKANQIPLVRVWTPWYRQDSNARELMRQTRQALPTFEKMALSAGVKIAFETHMGNIGATASMLAWLLEGANPEALGVIYDPGNMVYEGFENYKMGLEILGDYLAHVHVKNAIWQEVSPNTCGGKKFSPVPALMDAGFADIETLFKTLRTNHYEGFISVEDFSNTLSTDDKMAHTAEYLKKLLEVTHV